MALLELATLFGAGKIFSNNVDNILDGVGDQIDHISDETKEILGTLRGEIESLLDEVSDKFQGNLNYAIDELDTFTSNKIGEISKLINDVNDYVEDTVNLISDRAEEFLNDFHNKISQTIKEVEKSLSNLIVLTGETTTYVLHRATYNVLTVTSWALLGVGLIVIIVTLAKNGIPDGLGGILFLILMGIFVLLFGTLSLIPKFRQKVMQYTGLGLSGELAQREAIPQIFKIDPPSIKLGKTLELEIYGYDLLHNGSKPAITIGEQSVTIKADSNEKLIVNVATLSLPTGSSNLKLKYSEGLEVGYIVRVEKDVLPDLRIVSAQFTSSNIYANAKTKFRIVVQNFGKKATAPFTVSWKPTASHSGLEKAISGLGEFETPNDRETIEFEHVYQAAGDIVTIAEVDTRKNVEESDENNNKISFNKRINPLQLQVTLDLISIDFYLGSSRTKAVYEQKLRLRPQTQANWSIIDFSSSQRGIVMTNLMPGSKIALEGVARFTLWPIEVPVLTFDFGDIQLPSSGQAIVQSKTLTASKTYRGKIVGSHTVKAEFNIKYSIAVAGYGLNTIVPIDKLPLAAE